MIIAEFNLALGQGKKRRGFVSFLEEIRAIGVEIR